MTATTIRKAGPSKANAIDTIVAGDRVNCYHPGLNRDIWGTVVEVLEHRTTPGVNGPVFLGLLVRLYCRNLPTWPTMTDRTVDVFLDRFRSYSVRDVYTPAAD